MYDFIEKLMI